MGTRCHILLIMKYPMKLFPMSQHFSTWCSVSSTKSSWKYKEQQEVMQGRRLMSFISHNRPVGASTAGATSAARAETLFQGNNIIIFILENLQMQLTWPRKRWTHSMPPSLLRVHILVHVAQVIHIKLEDVVDLPTEPYHPQCIQFSYWCFREDQFYTQELPGFMVKTLAMASLPGWYRFRVLPYVLKTKVGNGNWERWEWDGHRIETRKVSSAVQSTKVLRDSWKSKV